MAQLRFYKQVHKLKINSSYEKVTEMIKNLEMPHLTYLNAILYVHLQCLFAVSYSWLLSLVTLVTVTTGSIS